MGGGSWNNDFYEDRARARAVTGTPVFKHDADVRAGRAHGIHEALDPAKMKNGVREARDSAEHPNSTPVLFGLDVTGSMREVPGIVQANLGKLMTTILTGGYLVDPQVCFLAIGDSRTDRVPLQVGQFESGLQMEDDLTKIFIEGQGGGTGEEGYEMALYFATHCTATDAWEKRKRKGYLFLTGDELAYPEADAHTIHKIFGGELGTKSVPLAQLVADATERYHVFFIVPGGSMHAGDSRLVEYWADLIGRDHVLNLTDPAQICDLVALTIGLTEGTAKAGSVEGFSKAIKAAIDPVLVGTKEAVASAKKGGAKTARL